MRVTGSASGGATPLLALDAVGLDLETTSVDAAVARIVQIGAVRIASGRLARDDCFEALVNPGIPVPPVSTGIHGLRDEDLKDAPPFAAVGADLEAFIGEAVLIGHAVGYDLTVLRNEYAEAGRPWSPPRALCVRMLARVVAPTLADYTLDHLCSWLGITVEHRHTGMGDAVMAAEVFTRLIDPLRARNIRTLAEAEAACARLGEEERRHTEAGWVHPSAAQDRYAARDAIRRIDAYPFRHRVHEIMHAPARFAPPEMTVPDAITFLLENGISSLFIRDQAGRLGIVTERDLLRALDPQREGSADARLGEIMSSPLHSVPRGAFLYRAMGRMNRLRIRHLAVTDVDGDIVGALTNRDLLRMRTTDAIALGDSIDMAQGPEQLAGAWSALPRIARSLLVEEVDARAIAAVVSGEVCAMTRRAAELAEARMAAEGKGGPPVPYAVLVLGSGARGESLLSPDQDNALIFAEEAPEGGADSWFEELGTHIAATLDAAGIPFCKGGVMAKNAAWRHSAAGWRGTVEQWISRSSPDDLLNVDIFFDAIPVHGDVSLGEDLCSFAFKRARQNHAFLRLIAEISRTWQSPFGFFGGLRTQDGRIDLKLNGLLPVVSVARVMAIRHGIHERSTPGRLLALRDLGLGAPSDFDRAIAAHRLLLGAILEQQLVDSKAGRPLSNSVETHRLDKARVREIRNALKNIRPLVDLVVDIL